MKKKLLFDAAAREGVLRGATLLAKAVRVTLGPKSKCVLIDKKWGEPIERRVGGERPVLTEATLVEVPAPKAEAPPAEV